MDIHRCVARLLLCAVCLGVAAAVPLRLFYPYGADRGDGSLPRGDDVSSTEYQLQTPINFYDELYPSIFVNSNGHVSFETELPGYQATMVIPLEPDVKLIAAFMADIDLSISGNVYFRETEEEALLQRAARDIRGHFSQFPDFSPLSLFIATWDNVGPYKGDAANVNTFQIVLASDELNSFSIFNYLDGGMGWVTSGGKLTGIQDDPPAQAGFDSGSGRRHLKLPYSGTKAVHNLPRDSNINLPGVWMYHIGNTKGSNVAGADLNTGDVEIFEPTVSRSTCYQGRRTCHQEALCIEYDDGFCCECVKPFYGNGIQCIEPGTPQRMNGKVSGKLNNVTFSDLDMHAFVVTKDGRAYTAISRVPEEIGAAMMTLNTIGGIIGWLFALPGGRGAVNGYTFTGGKFNRTAVIRYQNNGSVVIRQQFYGHDALNNIRMKTVIDGTVPDIDNGEKVAVDDYHEEYRRTAPGVLRSFSERTYRVDNVASRYTWNQTITFSECDLDPTKVVRNTMRLGVTRNFVAYDTNDRVVRFAMSNKIGGMTGTDPCREGAQTCDGYADCIPGDGTYTCECRIGFTGDGTTCQDIDECAIGLHTCDRNAGCYNSPGSFQCHCHVGYRGDGRVCTRYYEDDEESSGEVELCGDSICDDHAHCVFNSATQSPVCECKSGYSLDGDTCQPISFGCNEVDICHENAECLYDEQQQKYVCECVEGFSGDGVYCEKYDVSPECDCDANADCVYDTNRMVFRCVCKAGFSGNGQYCSPIDVPPSVCDDCHPNAACEYDEVTSQYECRCARGYQGDGTRCEMVVLTDCRDSDICDSNAQCGPDRNGYYVCRCNAGYRGNGQYCEPEGCNVENNCDGNAQCLPDPRDTSRYMCRCNPGFEGNGLVCLQRVVPCNQVENCAEYADCVYDPENLDFRCRCHRGYEGDGHSCTPRGVDCRRDPRLCDEDAECLLNVDTFVCVCKQGYRGDGQTCSAIGDEMNYLLFSRGYTIHRVPYQHDGPDAAGARVLYVPDELAIAVTSDCLEQEFYWTDVMGGKVSRASFDGYDKEVVAQGFSSPEGIAIDWLARNMYVTDSGYDVITVSTINGMQQKTLIREDLANPRAIVVDPHRGVMYWTDWHRDRPRIERANMDGTDRQVFVDSDLALPNGLTIDYVTQQICWGDAGTNRIECMRSDGVGRTVVTEEAPYPFDVAFYGNTIYWSDWTIDGVSMIHRNGGEPGEPITLPVGGNGRLYGIAAVGEYCPRATNACHRNNGGCRYLCLPTPNGGRTCACPDDVDEVTCGEIGVMRNKRK